MPARSVLPNTSSVQDWKFALQNNRSRFVDGGVSFFETQSRSRANLLGLQVLGVTHVKLKRTPPNSWTITGTVVLETS
jgi:hypothetical protein